VCGMCCDSIHMMLTSKAVAYATLYAHFVVCLTSVLPYVLRHVLQVSAHTENCLSLHQYVERLRHICTVPQIAASTLHDASVCCSSNHHSEAALKGAA
jgi:hypothetical protein